MMLALTAGAQSAATKRTATKTATKTATSTSAQARKVLDKTAAVVGNASGATASFSMSGKYGKSSGTLSVKEYEDPFTK